MDNEQYGTRENEWDYVWLIHKCVTTISHTKNQLHSEMHCACMCCFIVRLTWFVCDCYFQISSVTSFVTDYSSKIKKKKRPFSGVNFLHSNFSCWHNLHVWLSCMLECVLLTSNTTTLTKCSRPSWRHTTSGSQMGMLTNMVQCVCNVVNTRKKKKTK